MKKLSILLITTILIASCANKDVKYDADGILLADNLESSNGSGWDFSPMQNDDSAQVAQFKPTTYTFKGKPYTGKITAYDDQERKIFDGNLENGIASGNWKYYYPSGVVQIEGMYANGQETGMWMSYYTVDKPKVVKYYDAKGFLLMRKEYYDTGKIKNYQNVECPEFGGIARRIQFKYNGEIDYIDAERELGKLDAAELNKQLQQDKLLVK
jgi:antitoxin component YwqK of YwqJK toxin-antitoxin module